MKAKLKWIASRQHPRLQAHALTMLSLVLAASAYAAGPYPPDFWPTNIDASKKVHYIVVDNAFGAPDGNTNWTQSLGFVVGGDQTTTDVTICGATPTFTGKRSSTIPGYINIFDTAFADWNSVPQVDVLVQVYGDTSLLRLPPNSSVCRVWSIREGTTGSALETGNSINQPPPATNIVNLKWNWVLFSITNKVVNDGTGTNRYIGSIPAGSASGSQYSGVNNGTLRFGASSSDSYLNGVTVHAVAFAEAGAFGTTNDINQFEPPSVVVCDPVPDSNLVGIDFNAGVTNNLQIVETDNTMSPVTGVGPAGDQRKAIVPNGPYYNFGILNNYLGKPCNPNITVKVCVDFYDDPAFAGGGIMFGPESYATDPLGCNPPGIYPTSGQYVMQGTGQWIRKSWTIGGVNLLGINTAPLTGGPRFIATAPVAISRFYMAALRTTGPLAGQDPLADCYPDPLICQGVYGNYVELDLANSVTNGLDLGNNGGDQTYVVETAGPANDQRLSVRGNSAPTYNLNFAIVTNALGPTSQDNLHLAILVTYYDDPALAGQGFRPQVWKKQQSGSIILAFMDPPQNIVLQGTDKWRDAYWEIGAIRLDGVNQSPQAAARFECDSPIHFSRVRYQVVRPCGPTAGQNPFFVPVTLGVGPETNALVKLTWPYHAPQVQVQAIPALGQPWSSFLLGTNTVEGGETSVLRFGPTNSDNQFFRLVLTPQ